MISAVGLHTGSGAVSREESSADGCGPTKSLAWATPIESTTTICGRLFPENFEKQQQQATPNRFGIPVENNRIRPYSPAVSRLAYCVVWGRLERYGLNERAC